MHRDVRPPGAAVPGPESRGQLAPGHYILEAAGGVVLDLQGQGQPIPLDYRLDTLTDITRAMNGRQKFVAASSLELANEVLATLDGQRS